MLVKYSSRVLAFLIDLFVTQIICLLIVLFTMEAGADWEHLGRQGERGLTVVVFILYRTVFDAYFEGTIGRWLFGFRLLSETGEPARPGILVLRNLVLSIPVASTLFCISIGRRTLLDTMFNTYAVCVDSPPAHSLGRLVHRHRVFIRDMSLLLFFIALLVRIFY